jgi:hypothetical protein
MFATRNPSRAVAAGEPPTAEDAYEPSPRASSTRCAKQIDLWMDLVDIMDDAAAFQVSHRSRAEIRVARRRLTV